MPNPTSGVIPNNGAWGYTAQTPETFNQTTLEPVGGGVGVITSDDIEDFDTAVIELTEAQLVAGANMEVTVDPGVSITIDEVWDVIEVSTNTVLTAGQLARVDASGGAISITAAVASGRQSAAIKVDSSTNPVTILLGGGSQTVIYEEGHARACIGNGTTADAMWDRKPYGYADYLDSNLQSDSYTLVKSDAGKVVEMDKATANNLTVPPAADVAWVVGTTIEIYQKGAGQVTVVPGTGVTVRAPNGLKTANQYSTIGLRLRATNEWVLTGDSAT